MNRLQFVRGLIFAVLALAVAQSAFGQIPRIPRTIPGMPSIGGTPGHDHTPSIPSIPDFSNLIPHFPSDHPSAGPSPYYPPPSPQPQPQPQPQQPVEVEPPPNVLEVLIEKPEANEALPVIPVTAQMLADWHEETNQQIDKLIEQIAEHAGGHSEALDQAAEQAHEGQLTPAALVDLVHTLTDQIGDSAAVQELVSQDLFQLHGLSLLNNALLNGQPGLGIGALAKAVNIFIVINIPGVFIINVNVIIAPGWWPGPGPWVGPNWWWWNGPPQQAWWQPIPIEPPLPDSNRTPITSGVLLMNGEESAVNYTVNGRSYSMQPRQRQALPAPTAWTVAFSRGGTFGTARYRLQDGAYKFTITPDRGWELYQATFDVTLVNGSVTTPFHFVLNNRKESIPAGEQRNFKGKYPLYVKFDDGTGKVHQKDLEGGIYHVVATGSGALDIFAADAVFPSTPATEMAQRAKEQRINLFAEPENVTPSLFRSSQSAGVTEPQGPATEPVRPGLFGVSATNSSP